jgi:hypothetical protein
MFTETREQFKETDRRLMELFAESDAKSAKTFERLEKLIVKNDESFERQRKEAAEQRKKEEAKQRKKEEEQWKKEAEQRKKEEEQWKEEAKQRKKEEEQWKEEAEQRKKESDQRIAKLEKLIGGIGNSNGEMAEEFFFNAFRKDKIFMNEKYDKIQKGYFSSHEPHKWEFDIVFFNGLSVAIIETKYNAKPDNIDIDELISRIDIFKHYSPEYKNHNIYLGVAAMSFKSGLASKLHKVGIATIHPVGKKMVIYDKTVKAF